MTRLVPMSEPEFLAYMAFSIPAYAADKVACGEWSREQALALAQQSFDELLPQGLATLEGTVCSLGLSGIALHVFGHNAGALAPYTKLGFHTTDINMFKPMEPA
jgi:hypothetical protein